jgi:hypothetical protein
MSCEVCVGWMDGSRLMRVEIELASYCSTSAGSKTAPNQWRPAECGGPCANFGQREQGAPSCFLRLQNFPPRFVSPYTDSWLGLMHNLVDRLCFTVKESLRNAFLAAVRPIPSTFLLSTQARAVKRVFVTRLTLKLV